jgi:protein-S-isoprenylcysteine O-methyltransferase Ste14
MPGLALSLWGVYLLLAVVLRMVIQRRRTGSSGWRGISGAAGSAEWLGGVLFAVAVFAGPLAPVLDLADVLDPLGVLDHGWIQWLGVGLFAAGLCALLAAQASMGRSWRIGVDEQERTDLVMGGPFELVRNPIFTAMVALQAGLTLLVPNAVALGSFVALIAALQIQTRLVEEPYLLTRHGERYGSYAGRVGRFVPGMGRLRASDRRPAGPNP